MRVFLMSILASHAWTLIGLFNEMPALALRLSFLELIGVTAYYLLFAFFEALVVWMIINLLSAVLPAGILRGEFLSKGSLLLFMTYLWIIPLFYNYRMLLYWPWGRSLWIVLYLLLLALIQLAFKLILDLPFKLRPAIERLAVLASIYLMFDLLALIVVSIRNLG